VVPVSRWTEVRKDEVEAAGLPILLGSDETGPCLLADPAHRALSILHHFEYDSDTLNQAYERDLALGHAQGAPITVSVRRPAGAGPAIRTAGRGSAGGGPALGATRRGAAAVRSGKAG